MGLRGLLNVNVLGLEHAPPMVFIHGFGCGQEMWRHVVPSFIDDYRVVLFDLPGSGQSDSRSYDAGRHDSLQAYAADVVSVLHELGLARVTLVGHSVSAMISALVHLAEADLVARLVMISPSARYIDDIGYRGGFTPADIDDLLELMSRNHLGWQKPLAALVASSRTSGAGPDASTVDHASPDDAESGELSAELESSFCRLRPDVAREFAAVTFLGDNRDDLARVDVPTLVIQSEHDDVAPMSAGTFVARAIEGAQFAVIPTHGHCPHLSAPEATAAEITRFLARASS